MGTAQAIESAESALRVWVKGARGRRHYTYESERLGTWFCVLETRTSKIRGIGRTEDQAITNALAMVKK